MPAERPFDDAAPRGDDEAVLRRLLAELAAGRESAPDLTDRVMGRLGFVRCTEQERRRADFICGVRKAAVVCLMLVAALVGYFVASRREPDPSMALPSALGGAIERHGHTLRVVLDGLPQFSAPEDELALTVVPVFGFGAVPVIVIPVSEDGRGVRHGPWRNPDALKECPSIRRVAAQVPFPEA